jgi:FKBP-type peptidyl-prolyl cis-trans isomerase FklB
MISIQKEQFMKKVFFALLSLAFLATAAMCADKELKTDKEKRSYSMGFNIGSNISRDFKNQSIDVDNDVMARGITDALAGRKAALSEKEMHDAITGLQKEVMEQRAAKMNQMSEKNKKEGEAFLADNKNKPGVVTLPDGLQYKILKEGSGAKPKATDKVKVNYKGTFLNGNEFDSSYKRGQPAVFAVNAVVKGWTEVLQLMKEGSTFQVWVPSDLAYGEQGAGNVIGPNQTLIFEIELISIEK